MEYNIFVYENLYITTDCMNRISDWFSVEHLQLKSFQNLEGFNLAQSILKTQKVQVEKHTTTISFTF